MTPPPTDTRGRITITVKPEPGGEVLALTGAIDETAALQDLPSRARGGRLVLDLGGVTFINSLGVRDWIRMQTVAGQAGIAVELRRIAEPIVHQLNMIIATRGTAAITSFYAPYTCDGCGREESLLLDVAPYRERLVRLDPPPMPCSECGAQMSFNDFPERYFSFLSV